MASDAPAPRAPGQAATPEATADATPAATPDSTPAVSTRGLVKDFRGFRAVAGVDLDVAKGSVHALVGPNGAGKTTLFNLLTGFLSPTGGQVYVDGREVTGLPPERIAARGVARSFQVTSLFPRLTVREHLELALAGPLGHRFWRSARLLRRYDGRARELIDRVGLADAAEAPVETLAYGRKRALELALALALDPQVLLLDEPTAGMGMEDVDRTVELIGRIRDGRTVVMVEHNMSVVGALADRVSVLSAGKVLVEGPYQQVRADERVITAYLGASDAGH
jgi:branched-chain amino acid transport system ATP-binding protein